MDHAASCATTQPPCAGSASVARPLDQALPRKPRPASRPRAARCSRRPLKGFRAGDSSVHMKKI
eukprot:scaffold27547_cov96-Isochrysis_galbana.AAC.1